MDNSEVLDQQATNPIPDSPEQPDVAPEVLNDVSTQPNKSVYTNAIKPTTQMGEADHASEIASNAMSQAEAKQTYSYTSEADKDYDTSINTSTIQSNNAEMKGTFESEYTMGDKYRANENEDYQWNKLAADMAQSDYDQQANQARYESIQAKQEIDKAAATAFNNYFASEYSARQTQDKMGWSGGQQTASDLQVSFLQAEQAANMYTQDEMQKYGVDTKLGIARMYAEANQKALALQYYQDAVDLAVKEANETGYYIPPEAGEMMKQQKIAKDILNNPYSTDAEKARANGVNSAAQAYYDHLGFEHGTRVDEKTGKVVTEYYGIKTLGTLTYEETVRNNKINEQLQKQANQIAKDANGIAWSNYKLAEKQWKEYKEDNKLATIAALSKQSALDSGSWSIPGKATASTHITIKGKEYDVENYTSKNPFMINKNTKIYDEGGIIWAVNGDDIIRLKASK